MDPIDLFGLIGTLSMIAGGTWMVRDRKPWGWPFIVAGIGGVILVFDKEWLLPETMLMIVATWTGFQTVRRLLRPSGGNSRPSPVPYFGAGEPSDQ